MNAKLNLPSRLLEKPSLVIFSLLSLASIVCLTILQDYLHIQRIGSRFFLHESLIFKGYWLALLPIFAAAVFLFNKIKPINVLKLSAVLVLLSSSHLVLGTVFIWLLSLMIKTVPYGFIKVFTYVSSNDLMMTVTFIASFLFVLYHFSSRVLESKTHSIDTESKRECLAITQGQKKFLVAFSDIYSIQSATPYVAIELEEKRLLHSSSLKAIVGELDSRFVRVHRSHIVNIDKVDYVQSRLNGDYDLTLRNGKSVRLSRNYVKPFKLLFRASSA